jgi:magnesium chelatase family protein
VSLAHRGVLFLDEFPEFPRNVLESLRQPMEDGQVTISRAKGTVTYPANFLLVAASNPCPCGYFGDSKRACRCLPGVIARYQKRISGPIIDSIDLHISLQQVETEKLVGKNLKSDTSKVIQKRVQVARDIQNKRYKNTKFRSNSDLSSRAIKEFCPLSADCLTILRSAIAQLDLSARAYHKVIKVARTIADLAGDKNISINHLAEALQYRPHDEDLI